MTDSQTIYAETITIPEGCAFGGYDIGRELAEMEPLTDFDDPSD